MKMLIMSGLVAGKKYIKILKKAQERNTSLFLYQDEKLSKFGSIKFLRARD
jgi:hypothetical protein